MSYILKFENFLREQWSIRFLIKNLTRLFPCGKVLTNKQAKLR